MPVVLSPEHGGWVRVSPPKRRASPHKQAEALRSGALSYFACTPAPTKPSNSKLPPCPKYDLDNDNSSPPSSPKKKKSRVVSAPASGGGTESYEDEEYDNYSYDGAEERHSSRPRRRQSRERERDSHTHSSSSNYSHSQRDRESRRVVSAMPRASARPDVPAGQSKYWTGPSNRHHTSSAPRNTSNYARSSVSSSWASATRPLDL